MQNKKEVNQLSRYNKINPIKIESEHKLSYEKLKRYFKKYKRMPPKSRFYGMIATDHLKEYGKKYYKELIKMEKKLKKK